MSPRVQGGKMRTKMVDDGTISPKTAWPTGLLALAGLILMLLDQTGILTLDDGVWIAVLGSSGLTFGAGYSARPGAVVPDPEGLDELKTTYRDERGLADPLTLLVQVVAVVIVVVLAVWLIRELL